MEESERRRVGGWLQVLRVARGMSQEKAAHAAGLARSTLAGIERGHQRLSNAAWMGLARAYARPEWELGLVTDWRTMSPFIWEPSVLETDRMLSARAHAAVAARMADYLCSWEPAHLLPRWGIGYLGVLGVLRDAFRPGKPAPAASWGPAVEAWSIAPVPGSDLDQERRFGEWLATLSPDLLDVRYQVRVGQWDSGISCLLPPPLDPSEETRNGALSRVAELLVAIEAAEGDYPVRNALVYQLLAAATEAGMHAGVRIDPAEPEWPVIFVELPTGQVTWHVPQHSLPWDGHDTPEKYRRCAAFAGGCPVGPVPGGA